MLLMELGYSVHWVGRELPESSPLQRPYATTRMKLWFRKGGLFYAEFQVRLFFFLLSKPVDVLLSNDLDTLLPNFLVARIRKKTLVYDTHEYFCGVPEIQGRWVKKVWQAVERWIFPKLEHVWTVNESIAALYETDYGKRPRVFRNISPKPQEFVSKTRAELGLPEDKIIVINQGSGMNVDRGLEEAVEAVAGMDDRWVLLLVGSGDAIPKLKEYVAQNGWGAKVLFVDRVPYSALLQYTTTADIGISLDKGTNINYRYSLPNKLFDYIHCGIPVVTSEVVEVKRIVDGFRIGKTVDPEDLQELRSSLMEVYDQRVQYHQALLKASEELSWEKERVSLRSFYAALK
jgi:glycosyltransferase involved in cell wall biosynthesis